jgi:hypothetical protein
MGGSLERRPARLEGMTPTNLATARLLTEIAPLVFEGGLFALKGGTAINLFLREMPRLSVDLDLVFTDHRLPRPEALTAINEALRAAGRQLARRGLKVQVVSVAAMGETKLIVQRDDLSVKIEVNTVIRGTVYPTRMRALTAAASDTLNGRPRTPAALAGGYLRRQAGRRDGPSASA